MVFVKIVSKIEKSLLLIRRLFIYQLFDKIYILYTGLIIFLILYNYKL